MLDTAQPILNRVRNFCGKPQVTTCPSAWLKPSTLYQSSTYLQQKQIYSAF